MRDIDNLEIRELQKLAARVMVIFKDSDKFKRDLSFINKQAIRDSVSWYKIAIQWYIEEFHGWPDETGPAKDIKLILDN